MVDFLLGNWYWIVFMMFAGFYWLCGINIVNQWERKPLKRWGRFCGTLGPGIAWREPLSTRIINTIDIRDTVDDLYSELGYKTYPTIQTHDNVPVAFGLYLTYRIKEASASDFVLNVAEDHGALWKRALSITNACVSNTELDAILHEREALCTRIVADLQAAVSKWGIEIIAVEMRDIMITDTSIQEAIAMKARAAKEAEAELTRANMQHSIAIALSLAGDAYDEAAWRLKGIETLLELCRSAQNNTVLVPTDMIEGLARIAGGK